MLDFRLSGESKFDEAPTPALRGEDCSCLKDVVMIDAAAIAAAAEAPEDKAIPEKLERFPVLTAVFKRR